MPIQMTDYKRVPIAELTTPKNGICNVYKDYWWAVTENEEALFFRGVSAQCNMNKQIVERLMPEGCKAVLIPVAFVKVNISDYA